MPDIADFALNLELLGLTEEQLDYHELRIEYPALDLLPTGQTARPYLRQPQNSGFRESPIRSSWYLQVAGTEFSIRFPLESTPRSGFSPIQLIEVFAATVGLSRSPGCSVLEIVSYRDASGNVYHRFRLSTKYGAQYRFIAESVLGDRQWEAERASCLTELWIELIADLINRASDRAYLRVREHLRTHRWYRRQTKREQWNHEPTFVARQLLGANLKVVVGTFSTGWYTETLKECDFEGQGKVTFQLPCGHELESLIEDLRGMTVADCIACVCPECGEKVMRLKDLRLLCKLRERQRRAKYWDQEALWKQVDESWLAIHQESTFQPSLLVEAMRHAWQSLHVPRSLSPTILSPVKSGEVRAVVKSLVQETRERNGAIVCSSAELLDELMQCLDRGLGRMQGSSRVIRNFETLPSGWGTLLFGWIVRTVQLASVPGYDGRSISEIFNGEAVEGSQSDKDGDAVDELEDMLRNAHLE